MNSRYLKLLAGLPLLCACQGANAALLDLTNSGMIASLTNVSNGYRGTIDGVGFTITSTNGKIVFPEKYDGSTHAGCLSAGGALKCDKDGAGIGDDEITGIGAGNEILTLAFDKTVNVTGFQFLDLYRNPNGKAAEQATISLDGAFLNVVNATATPGDGGYARLLTAATRARIIQFSAAPDPAFWDDHNNDYALAAVNVNPVPLPAAAWLFGSAIAGLIGFRRSRVSA